MQLIFEWGQSSKLYYFLGVINEYNFYTLYKIKKFFEGRDGPHQPPLWLHHCMIIEVKNLCEFNFLIFINFFSMIVFFLIQEMLHLMEVTS